MLNSSPQQKHLKAKSMSEKADMILINLSQLKLEKLRISNINRFFFL